MATINTDCHLTLTHPDVNSGNAYGFILQRPSNENDPAVHIQREVDSDSGDITVKVFFTVLLADDLIDPDGGPHTADRDTMYAMLTDFLSQTDGMTVTAPIGAIAGIGASGHSATETHFPAFSTVAIQLTNVSEYFGPINYTNYNLSVWDGTLTWDTSYWR